MLDDLVASLPHQVTEGETEERAVEQAVVRREIDRRGKTEALQRGEGAFAEVGPAVVERDNDALRRQLALVQQSQGFAKRKHATSALGEYLHSMSESLRREKHLRIRPGFFAHGDAVIAED